MNTMRTMMLLAALTALFMAVGWLLGGGAGMVMALIFAAATNLWAWWNSDKAVLRWYRARPATEANAPGLVALTQALARRAGLPAPRVYLIDEDQPNAFATGRDPAHAAVAVTTGLLRTLSRDELAGVIAHELAHVKNRDTLTMTVAATVGGAIAMLAQFGMFFGGGRDRGPLGLIGALAAAILAPFAAMLIQMMISRTREYAADREGAMICGDPLALASALRRIAAEAGRRVNEPAERDPATAPLFIVNPLSGRGMDNLFATHPPVESRIAALEALAREMGRAPARPAGAAGGPGAVARARPSDADAPAVTRVPRAGRRRIMRGFRKGPWS
ncbi:zinc metalloprotease HtpX [Oceanicella actignis]|uniref:Protease HtpX homolog n=1 Tax=Oceanicella actignis TaxID=1189325 RepID=A0A1M7TJV1_9RHOB|nr:zinc metalloprotease HtpX [Oceanicella actignis]TYO88196.1 heat shock protein HtpX [Oceanicella actignis]SET67256.1 heat shock protein HtpX [Oceanicella actignis]SHN70995.1 heat shock protein HtpX [Oceanicella actignis]